MTWEEALLGFLDDLEQQATGLHLVERDAEVAELSVAEYAQVSLRERLHASTGRRLVIRVLGGQQLAGRLARMGEDWLMLVEGERETIVRTAAVASATGLSPRADHESTWSVLDRLGLRSLLRRLAADGGECLVRLTDDQQVRGRLGRVGQDFVEVLGERRDGAVQAVPYPVLATLQEAP